MKPGIKHSFSLEKCYHEPLSVTTLPMRSMEWRDSVDSMEINGFPWISMEFMDSMESMDSMDSMESMEIHGNPWISIDFHGINRISPFHRTHGKGRDG